MYCSNCGQEIDERAIICPHCGVPTQNYNKMNPLDDKGGFLWGLLGFCLPPVGLVLYLVWKDTKPKTAGAVGTGALVNVSAIVLLAIISEL